MFDSSGPAFFSVLVVIVLVLMYVSALDTPMERPAREGTWYLWRSDGRWHSSNEPYVGAEAIYTRGRMYVREPAATPDNAGRPVSVWLQNQSKH